MLDIDWDLSDISEKGDQALVYALSLDVAITLARGSWVGGCTLTPNPDPNSSSSSSPSTTYAHAHAHAYASTTYQAVDSFELELDFR